MPNVALTTSAIAATTYGGTHDHLPLPNGSTIGQTPDTQVLRKIFARMGIEGAHRERRGDLRPANDNAPRAS